MDGAIHRAAGPELLAECRTLGGCPTGEARITKGYRLAARYVIHTVGPVYRGTPQDRRLLANCYTSSLKLAVAKGVRTIAFPSISCGVYGYPIEEACKVALEATLAFLEQHSTIEKVLFVQFGPHDHEVYRRQIDALR